MTNRRWLAVAALTLVSTGCKHGGAEDDVAAVASNTTLDLAPAGAAWQSWSVQAPSTATVMNDIGAARVVINKAYHTHDAAFDISFRFDKPSLALQKVRLQQIAATTKSTVAFITDQPGLLTWKTSTATATNFGAMAVMNVQGHDVSCSTVTAPKRQADLARIAAACSSLALKP